MSRRSAGARLVAALVALAGVLAAAALGVETVRSWTYQLAWYPLLIAVDAGLALRDGRGPLSGRPRFAVSLFAWSVPAWLLFEAANFRLANWYYVMAPPERSLRWLGGAIAFATVLPAIRLAHAALDRLGAAASWRRPRFAAGPRHRRALFGLGCLFVLLAGWRPDAFYPLVWGAVTLLLEPFNHSRAPERSLLGDLAAGSWTRIARLLAAGALVGLAWEALNSVAGTRWIYTVPGLEGWKLFEMPLPGFLGFPVLALDGFVLYQTLVLLGVAVPGWGEGESADVAASPSGGRPAPPPPAGRVGPSPPGGRPARIAVAAAAAATFSLLVLVGIDRFTIDSLRPSLEDVPGVSAPEAQVLRAAGIRAVGDLAARAGTGAPELPGLGPREVEGAVRFARLATLRGIGARNAYGLRAAGVATVCDLATADAGSVAAAVRAVRDDPNAGRPARVRVWLRAARESCADSGREVARAPPARDLHGRARNLQTDGGVRATGPAAARSPGDATGPAGTRPAGARAAGEPAFGRFFLPGPTEVRPEVLDALRRPVFGHRGPEMRALLAGIDPSLRALFRTTRPVYLSTSSASGLMEAAITNLVRRRALCLVGGAFGERFLAIARACGREADALRVEWGEPTLPEAVREALRREPGRYDLVTVVHSETSTGVLNPLREIAEVVRAEEDVLLAVDGVTSVAGTPVEFDAWGLDFLLTGSQKALALPPGLALGVASERALRRAEETPARGYYFDLLAFERNALAHETTNTPAVSLLFALQRQLERIGEEGLESRWTRHRAMAERTHARVRGLAERTGRAYGVLAPPGYRSPTVTAVRLPDGVTGPAVTKTLRDRGWTIAPGYGPLRESTLRIGHMGDHTLEELDALLDELESVVVDGRAG